MTLHQFVGEPVAGDLPLWHGGVGAQAANIGQGALVLDVLAKVLPLAVPDQLQVGGVLGVGDGVGRARLRVARHEGNRHRLDEPPAADNQCHAIAGIGQAAKSQNFRFEVA